MPSSVETQIAVVQTRLDDQREDIEEIKADLRSIRKGLWLAAGTFASLAVGIFVLVAQGV